MPAMAVEVCELPVREPDQEIWSWPGLGALDARAWLVLWRESGHGARDVVVTFEWLAEVLGRSRSSAQRYLAALLAAGLVVRLCREQRGFRYRVVDPATLGRIHLARGCDPQRRIEAVENAEPISGPECGPTFGIRVLPSDFTIGSEPVARVGPGAAEPCQPVGVHERCSTDHAGARSEKITITPKDPDPIDPELRPTETLFAEAALAVPDGREFALALEAQAASLHAAVDDPELTLGFCRKVCEARLAAAPDGGSQLPRADVEKILDRLWQRRNLPQSHPDGLKQPPRAFFIAAICGRFQEINGRAWPRSPAPRTQRRAVA